MTQSTYVVVAVDDDRRVRDSVQSVLESAGYETERLDPPRRSSSPAPSRAQGVSSRT